MTKSLDEWRARRKHETNRKRRSSGPTLAHTRKVKVKNQPCRVCGTHQNIEAHHIVPRGKLGPTHPNLHSPDNIMPVCHIHHQLHHTGGTSSRIPRHTLTPTERRLATRLASETWLNYWYPTQPANLQP